MIVIRFGGGLGNQLFQFCVLLQIKRRYPVEDIFCDTTQYLVFNEHCGFEIPKLFDFCFKELPANETKLFHPVFYRYLKKGRRIKNLAAYNRLLKRERLILLFRQKTKKLGFIKISDGGSQNYSPSFLQPFQKEAVYYLDGGWQSFRYYEGVEKDFKPSIVLSENKQSFIGLLEQELSVGIHIRGGDFLNHPGFSLCKKQYYSKAIDLLAEKKGENKENFHFWVFTDDREFAKKILGNLRYSFIPEGSSGEDLFLMSHCRNLIISNSTFSYWGALLNGTSNKTIISPKYYFRKNGVYYKIECPNEWYIVNNYENAR